MGILKWLGCILAAILGVSVIAGGALLSAFIGLVLGVIALGTTVILFVAYLIKEGISKRFTARKSQDK